MTKVLGKGVMKARKGVKRSRRVYNMTTKYFNYEPRFNGVYSKENLTSKERNAFDFRFIDRDIIVYFDSFGTE